MDLEQNLGFQMLREVIQYFILLSPFYPLFIYSLPTWRVLSVVTNVLYSTEGTSLYTFFLFMYYLLFITVVDI